jgi:hypothetical protein
MDKPGCALQHGNVEWNHQQLSLPQSFLLLYEMIPTLTGSRSIPHSKAGKTAAQQNSNAFLHH